VVFSSALQRDRDVGVFSIAIWGNAMNVLFLDIDGVVNRTATRRRRCRGLTPIEPRLARIVQNIARSVSDLKIVLSSAWREIADGRALVEEKIPQCFDVTPIFDEADDVRGYEIQAWLEHHPSVTRYVIVDDDCDMLDLQRPHFFRTSSKTGITQELAAKIVAHLNR
jgi:HAD domain in Swiss Army Knife RNA repair proteins